MKKGNIIFFLFLFIVFSASTIGQSFADSAEVLPKGVFRINVQSNFYLPIDERYNPDGDAEDAAIDYNASLNSDIFPALGLIESGFGMPPGSAGIGSSVVSFEYTATELEMVLLYGITDRLTVGIKIPYRWIKNDVDSRLDLSTATVGRNPLFGTPGDPFLGSPVVPIALGGIPLTTEQAKDLVSGGLDVNDDGQADIPGFGYKRFKTWSDSGVKDIDIGLRYQYLKTEKWRLAVTGGIGIPTGKVDDTDNLVDLGFGTGAYALFFHLNNDYTGIKNLVLNATFKYDLYLPDTETLRVPEDVNQPITSNKEKVDRDLGDVIELEASGTYSFLRGWNAGLTYKYGFSFKDRIDGDKGFNYKSLEEETDYEEHVFIAGLSYSTIPLFMEKKFPVPLAATLSYRNRFAGSNNVFKSEYIGLGIDVFF